MKSSQPSELAPPILPNVPAMPHRLDAAAALAFQTPLQEHAPAADGKAGAILTVIGLMFSLLAGQSSHISQLIAKPGLGQAVLFVGLVGFSLLGLGTVIESFRTIAPRFPAAPPSLAFFADIARLEREEYVRRVEAMSADEALEQILRYNHTLAGICVLKFDRLKRAIHLFRPAFVCWLGAMSVSVLSVVFR
jgi:hypothetical protein